MICKSCKKDKEQTVEFFHKHPDNKTGLYGTCRECRNKQRNERKSKYTYFYEILKNGVFKEGKIKAADKDRATVIMKIRFRGWTIEKLCTFKYKNNPIVRKRKGLRNKK